MLVATAEETREGETRRREEAMKAAEDKDAKLKAALAKVTDLKKTLQERDCTIARELRGTLLEVQHLEDSFSSKCSSSILPGWDPGFLSLVIFSDLLLFLTGAFPETRELAEDAVRF